MLIAVITVLAALLQVPQMFTLTVDGGTGSGSYACGSVVRVSVPQSSPTFWTDNAGVKTQVAQDLLFDKWDGDYAVGVTTPAVSVTMPCRNVFMFGRYVSDMHPVSKVVVR